MIDFTNVANKTYKQKLDGDLFILTLCEHNKQIAKVKFKITDDIATLEHIFVEEYSRLNGYAKLLFSKALQLLKQKYNIAKVIIDTTHYNSLILYKIIYQHNFSINKIGTNIISANLDLMK